MSVLSWEPICERGLGASAKEEADTERSFLPAASVSWDFRAALVSRFALYFPSLENLLEPWLVVAA